MLVLSRHEKESIMIGSGENLITVTVVKIRGERVRIGIEAPAQVPIHRREVFEAIQRDRRAKEEAQKEVEKKDNQPPAT